MGLIYFVILPLIAKINGLNDQIQEENLNQESVKLHIAQLPKIQQQYQALKNNMELENVLLEKEKAVPIIEKLEKMAENTNNEITIKVQESLVAEPVRKVTKKVADSTDSALVDGLPSPNYLEMKITLNGEYNSVVRFISMLERFEYYSDIISIQINKSKISEKSEKPFSGSDRLSIIPSSMNDSANKQDAQVIEGVTALLSTVFYTN